MSAPAHAAPGDLDSTFTPIIANAFGPAKVFDIAALPNGQILIGGEFTTVNGQARMGIARLNADGSLDPDFAVPLDYATIRKIHPNADGTIFIGGNFRWGSSVDTIRELARLSATGALMTDYDLRSPNFASTSNTVYDIVVEPDGAIVIGGQFYYLQNINVQGLARLDTAGGVQGLGVSAGLNNDIGTSLTVTSIVRQDDGKLIVGGTFVATGGRHALVRTLSDGNIDATFDNLGTFGSEQVNAVALQPDGKILAAGYFTKMAGQDAYRIARLNADGTLDTQHDPLSTFSMGAPLSMRLQADGKVLLGGILGPINNEQRNGILRLTPSLGLDSFYPNPGGVSGEVWAIDYDGDGRVLIGGFFNTVAGVARPTVARLLDTPNNAPQLTAVSLSPSVSEGSVATLTGSVSDADGDALTLSVNWGDGSQVQTFSHASGENFNHIHTYVDDDPTGTVSDPYTVIVTVSDSYGGSDSQSPGLTVNNVAPTLSNLSLSATTITAGSYVTLGGTVDDAGIADSHSLVINWADGSPNTTFPMAAGTMPFSAQHQYAAAGSYTIDVSVSDDDLGMMSDNSMTVTVNPALLPPDPPTNFNAVVTSTRVGKNRVYSASLTWTDNSGDETSFLIQRYTKGRKNSCVLETGSDVTRPADSSSYTDATATASTCGYQIRSQNGNGNSIWVRDMNIGTGVTP